MLAFLSVAPLALCQAPGDQVAAWNQWRGPTRDGRVTPGGHPWPASIGETTLRLLWRASLGDGYSSPIIGADRVFAVETEANEREVVRAFDRATGKELWNTDGERILALDQKGELLLLRPNPTGFVLLERRRVSDQDTWAHLAVTDGQLFIRELNGIAAWAWK